MNRRVLLVSDVHHFSTYDLYTGYRDAFKKLKIDFECADMAELVKYYSEVNSWGMIFSKMMNVECEFTHVLFISGLVIPDWVLKSSKNLSLGVIATDDPHAGKILMNKKKWFKYYFTNEKKMEDWDNNIFYLPTATSSMLPTLPKNEISIQYHSNICFVGTVYDDRIKPLEDVCKYCEDNSLVCKIVGPLCNTPKDSIIRKHAQEGIMYNGEAKLIYRASDVVLNIDRNVNWNVHEKNGNSILQDVGEAYSSNPRMYEIAGCKTPQLFIHPRQEVKDIFGDNVFYCNEDNIKEGLDQIFKGKSEEILVKVNNCFNKVIEEHTYYHRTKQLFDYIDMVDGEMVSRD